MQIVPIACPSPASSLQGALGVSRGILAGGDLGEPLRQATEQAKLGATCNGGIVGQSRMQ